MIERTWFFNILFRSPLNVGGYIPICRNRFLSAYINLISKKISKISKYIKCNSLCREDSSILAHRGSSRNTHVMARKKNSCCTSQRQSTNNAVYNFMGLKKFIQLCAKQLPKYITKFELVLCETFYNPCYFRTLRI